GRGGVARLWGAGGDARVVAAARAGQPGPDAAGCAGRRLGGVRRHRADRNAGNIADERRAHNGADREPGAADAGLRVAAGAVLAAATGILSLTPLTVRQQMADSAGTAVLGAW